MLGAALAGELLCIAIKQALCLYTYEAQKVIQACDHAFAGFYKGRIAEAIVDVLRKEQGVMTAEDMAHHRTVITRPIHTSYRGYTIYEVPPPTQVLLLASSSTWQE